MSLFYLGDWDPRRAPQSSQVAKEVEVPPYSAGKGTTSLFMALVTDDFLHWLIRGTIVGLLLTTSVFWQYKWYARRATKETTSTS